jgi:hypothetical protein
LRAAGQGVARAAQDWTRLLARSGIPTVAVGIRAVGRRGISGQGGVCGERIGDSAGSAAWIRIVRFYFRGTEVQRYKATRWRQCHAIRTSEGALSSRKQAIRTQLASLSLFLLSVSDAFRLPSISVPLYLGTSKINSYLLHNRRRRSIKRPAAIPSRSITVPLNLCPSKINSCVRQNRHKRSGCSHQPSVVA